LHSNQIAVHLVHINAESYAIEIHRGALVIATADLVVEMSEDSVPVSEVRLHTADLSDFNTYPLYVFAHEPESFFRNRGYGRLSLFFAMLHTICLGVSARINCDNVITAYILFQLFCRRGAGPPPVTGPAPGVDYDTDRPGYLQSLALREAAQPRMQGLQDFEAWHAAQLPAGGVVSFIVRPTEKNKRAVAQAVNVWSNDLVHFGNTADFLARFMQGPTRAAYNTSPVLQMSHPELTYAHQATQNLREMHPARGKLG